ncbi:glycosyltransferase family 2 protein [Brachyspira murdochii]|uniref:Glycosyl transferase family 2 n=1 Tax=Brachyspira murdochii (strain ATCC 51284 / DSM 12563 / 56-150) TaxID=526224 RepID=D5U4I6_BRAM5|nr:glycosyltransferase family 2 protein [Brachyspira murdochii]ADG70231.1 glycosyl transferase family 2 [Brachyspira murdochii DSM 12563]
MNTFPLVSVLIPTYNRKDLLKRALESVLKQTYKNIEIYVTDNASTDGTFDFMQEFSKSDKRIIYNRREKNIGPLYNGSEAYKHLKGKYAIILCDDDYFISNTFFENSVKAMEENENIVIVRGVVKCFNEKNNNIFIDIYNSKEYIKGIDYLLNYANHEGYDNITSFFAMFRKSAADKTEVFSKALPSGDTWLWLYLFLYGDVYFLSNEIIGCYVEHNFGQDKYNIDTISNIDYMNELIIDLKTKAKNLYPNYANEIDIKIEKIFSNILIWHTAQLCKVIGKKKAFKIIKSKEIIKKYPKIKSAIFGSLTFTIPFKLVLFGIEVDEKFIQLFIFGFSINIRRKKYV